MTQKNNGQKSQNGLARRLGLFDSTMMMVGIVIGSGIFLTSGIMAKSLPSAGLILLAWAVGGLLALAGALTFAELGAAMPQAGGQYVYLREAYGHLAGFLFGWMLFFVSMGGAIAAGAVGFAEYMSYFFPFLSTQELLFSTSFSIFDTIFSLSLSMGQIVAVAVIVLFSAFNYIGVGLGKTIQNIMTVVKIGTMVLFIIIGFVMSRGTPIDFSLHSTAAGLSLSQLLVGFGIALVAVSWAFDGWHNINYIAGEIKDPKRNLPMTLILGMLIIISLYLLMNVIYVIAVPIDEMSGVVRIAEKAAGSLFGNMSAGLVSAAVIISTLGSLNGAIFVAPRVYYAMAKDKIFFQKVSVVHPKFRTPSFAILLQCVWASILAISGSYEQIFTYVTFANIIFWLAGTSSVFRLRKKYPDLHRPYKTLGYPFVPILFIISLIVILVNTLLERPVESLLGAGLLFLGIPVYYYWKIKNKLVN
jgi:basic amino acid/polyamine antiporter, APA family